MAKELSTKSAGDPATKISSPGAASPLRGPLRLLRRRISSKKQQTLSKQLSLSPKSDPATPLMANSPISSPGAPGDMFPTIPARTAEGVRTALDVLERSSLKTEGLWRETADASEVVKLALGLAGNGVTKLVESADAHVVVGAIKRTLKHCQPLTTYCRCGAFVTAALSDGGEAEAMRKKAVRALVEELPAINRQLLGRVASHCKRVVAESDSNGMTWRGLSVSLAPTLLRCAEETDEDYDEDEAEHSRVRSRCLVLATERILKIVAGGDPVVERAEPASGEARLRSVRCRRMVDGPTRDERELRHELIIFGKISRLAFTGPTEALVLFETHKAAKRALGAKNIFQGDWQVTTVDDAPQPKVEKKKKKDNPAARVTQAFRVQRGVPGDPKGVDLPNPLSFSTEDLNLVVDEDDDFDGENQTGQIHTAFW